MFTDVVGYTTMAQINESRALLLLEEHRKLVRSILPSYSGKEVKTIGDAFLVEFGSALEAVKCAVHIQTAMHDRNERLPKEERTLIRVGVHVGDVVREAGDILGDAVNVASRIEPLAEPGGVCISEQAFDHVRNKLDLPMERLEEKTLKNVRLPVDVYRIGMPWEDKVEDVGRLDPKRVAVLPFTNMSPDPNDEYFTDGMTEELISTISKVQGLGVISRTSVMQYKGHTKHVGEIGRELNVGTLVEGSVRKAGNKIRIAVQLIDANSDVHLWSENYDRNLDDVFAIQSDVASKVAGSLKAGVLGRSQGKETEDLEAYTMYIRACQLIPEGTESSLKEALGLLQKVVERDPRFARAYSATCEAWTIMCSLGYEDFSEVAKAEAAARKALELAPDGAESHAAMGQVAVLLDRSDEAISELESAIKINPNLATAHTSLGLLYSAHGELEKGIASFKRGYDLDPVSYRAAHILAVACLVAGKSDESLAILERLRNINPRSPRPLIGLAEWHMMQRDYAKAQELLDEARRLGSDDLGMRTDQGTLYALQGKRKEAETVLAEIMKDKSESVRLTGQLFIYTALGDTDRAFKALMRQSETHSWPFLIKSHPHFEELRKDPRFREFCLKVGIPP